MRNSAGLFLSEKRIQISDKTTLKKQGRFFNMFRKKKAVRFLSCLENMARNQAALELPRNF